MISAVAFLILAAVIWISGELVRASLAGLLALLVAVDSFRFWLHQRTHH